MRSSTALVTLMSMLCACASRQPAKTAHAQEAPDAGSPLPARSGGDVGQVGETAAEASDAGPAAPGWLAVPPNQPWAATLIARESPALAPFEFSTPDGRFSGGALASGPLHVDAVKDGEAQRVNIPIGANATVNCALHSTAVLPGSRTKDLLDKLGHLRAVRSVAVASVQVAQGAPVIYVDVLYSALEGKAAGDGELKLAFVVRGKAQLVCSHDGFGYRRTFERVVQALAESTRDAQAKALPKVRLLDIATVRAGTRLLGFQMTREFAPRPDGSHDVQSFGMRIEQRPGDKPRFTDTVSLDKRGPGSRLRDSKVWLNVDDRAAQYVVEEEREGTYSVRGTLFGKAFSEEVKPQEGFRDLTNAELLAIAAGTQPATSIEALLSDDPPRIDALVVRKGAQEHELVAKSSDGTESIWTLDDAGDVKRDESLGPDRELTERIWSQAAP